MWRFLVGWIRRTKNIGMSKYGMADGGMSVGKLTYGLSYVWILSSPLFQPFTKRGIWDDSEAWTDTNVWYD